MEASYARYPPFHRTFSTSPPPLRRVRNLRHHGDLGRRPAMRSPGLQRITTALNRSHRNPIQHSLTTTSSPDLSSDLNLNSAMDDSNAKNEIKSDSSAVKVTKETQKPSEIPPPPEKPLPGDCCGSGCVRCVWDVYYEELEEYNKLRKGESGSTVGSKPTGLLDSCKVF